MKRTEFGFHPINEERQAEKGVTTVEYAVMLVLVAIAVAAFGAGLSGAVTGVFNQLVTALGA